MGFMLKIHCAYMLVAPNPSVVKLTALKLPASSCFSFVLSGFFCGICGSSWLIASETIYNHLPHYIPWYPCKYPQKWRLPGGVSQVYSGATVVMWRLPRDEVVVGESNDLWAKLQKGTRNTQKKHQETNVEDVLSIPKTVFMTISIVIYIYI